MADTPSNANAAGPGGFLPPTPTQTLPSPAPSGTTSTPSSSSGLPHPRAHPLRAGSAKEETTRGYIDGQLMYIQRRFVKKFQPRWAGDDLAGYKSVGELCKDVEALLNIIWLSGTRKGISLSLLYCEAHCIPCSTSAPRPPPALGGWGLVGSYGHRLFG